jgi:hypothetical protein
MLKCKECERILDVSDAVTGNLNETKFSEVLELVKCPGIFLESNS